MAPDLNSLPASRPSGSPLVQRPRRMSMNAAEASRPTPPSPGSPSITSMHAAAPVHPGAQQSPSRYAPSLHRRRSSLMNNLSNLDPASPASSGQQQSNGNNSRSPRHSRRSFTLSTVDPHHQRQLSLGELHQELENEQEAQTNRLLRMIRQQQAQLAALGQQPGQDPSAIYTDPVTAFSAALFAPASAAVTEQSSPRSTSNAASSTYPLVGPSNTPHSLSRRSSARPSNIESSNGLQSPAFRPQSVDLGHATGEFLLGGAREDAAFYQAETQNLTKENQMLKARIRELERQMSEMSATAIPSSYFDNSTPPSSVTHQSTTSTGECLRTGPIEAANAS